MPDKTPVRSINKLLIANRGEIALRVMRTARHMGIETVAVYSDADRGAPHAVQADEAVYIGPAQASESYLNIAAIVAAAQKTGADAIHPGYGFLSENSAFAQACLDAGLIFVGPPPHAILAMGDKAEAKRLMRTAGLPCVPGYEGDDQSEGRLAEEAGKIGYPVMIKATAGGGGRGMRIVDTDTEFGRLLQSAKSEARSAFGSDRVIIERVVLEPRHIEIQVLTDRHGNGVHLGERDCSVQRRHQKVIEEAPAPHISASLREKMGRAAVKASLALGYEGVGTFEFLLDTRGEFYFMEMNTRLQVEHPVTEAITGIDLVEWQLRVAMNEPLGFRQQDVRLTGHAIEVRLCAEDEVNGFLPQSGTIDYWSVPDTVRVEHAASSGAVISPYYDSMFAKLIAYGHDREEARRKLIAALRKTVTFGIATNRQTLLRCLQHEAFAEGGVHTGFLQQYHGDLIAAELHLMPLNMAVAALVLCHPGGGAAAAPMALRLHDQGSVVHEVLCTPQPSGVFRIEAEGGSLDLVFRQSFGNEVIFGLDGVDRKAVAHVAGDKIYVQIDGQAASFTDVTYAPAVSQADVGSDGRVRAKTNGQVMAVMVVVGDEVRMGDQLVTIEAMKMEFTHTAPVNGRVMDVLATTGEAVSAGRLIVAIEPDVKA